MSTYAPQQTRPSSGALVTARTHTEAADSTHSLLRMQRAAGNQAVQRMIAGGASITPPHPIRAKLTINAPDDPLEEQAERVAEHVTRSESAAVHGDVAPAPAPSVARAGASSAANVPEITPSQDAAIGDLRGRGAPLPETTRAFFEPRFGRDLGALRVHTDDRAGTLARSIDAAAFTVGNDIAFAPGRFAPETSAGRRLLAHEITHTLQNGSAPEAGAARIQREPGDKPAQPPAGPPAGPAPKGTDDKKDEKKDAKMEQVAKKAADEPIVYNLLKAMYQDLRYGKDFSADEKKKFQLKGTESASYWALGTAAVLPIGGAGGLKYGPDFSTSLSTFGKYLDAIEPLTPSKSIKTDLASRIIGLRVDEYLASDTFLSRLKAYPDTVSLIFMLAQQILSLKTEVSAPSADVGGFVDEKWKAHLGLVTGIVGLIFKEKLKAPGVFDIGPLLTPTHPLYASDTYFGGNLPSGLNIDAAKGLGGPGDLLHVGATLNLPKFIVPNDKNKLGAADLDDPTKYRGPQFSIWGDYQHILPTQKLADQGRVADRRFRAGALFGSDGVFVLADVGGHYSGPDARKLTSMFFTEGLAYAPPGGSVVKKIGFKVTQLNWDQSDSLAPQGTGAGGGWATRVSPFGSFQFKLGGSTTLGVGGSAGLTTGSGESLSLSDFRGDISLTYLGADGTTDLPKFRIELSGSGSRVDYFDPSSPMLYGVRGKMQVGPLFYGAQVNLGADKVPAGRAAQMGDPRTEGPENMTPGGKSVLIVVGITK